MGEAHEHGGAYKHITKTTSDELNRPGQEERKKEGMMEMKAEEDEHQNPLLSNRCESAVRGNRISSIDYDIQPAINCNMRWGFSRTAE